MGGGLNLRKLIARLTGARLCYGKPVRAGDRVVIPVASVQVAGGGGFGRGGPPDQTGEGTGGGGGGWISATPIGYIEVSPERARFRPIIEPSTVVRTATALAAAAAASRRVRRWVRESRRLPRRRAGLRSPRRLLPR